MWISSAIPKQPRSLPPPAGPAGGLQRASGPGRRRRWSGWQAWQVSRGSCPRTADRGVAGLGARASAVEPRSPAASSLRGNGSGASTPPEVRREARSQLERTFRPGGDPHLRLGGAGCRDRVRGRTRRSLDRYGPISGQEDRGYRDLAGVAARRRRQRLRRRAGGGGAGSSCSEARRAGPRLMPGVPFRPPARSRGPSGRPRRACRRRAGRGSRPSGRRSRARWRCRGCSAPWQPAS